MDVTEPTVGEQRLEGQEVGVPATVLEHVQLTPAGLRVLDQGGSRLGIGRHRLVDDDVQAVVECRP